MLMSYPIIREIVIFSISANYSGVPNEHFLGPVQCALIKSCHSTDPSNIHDFFPPCHLLGTVRLFETPGVTIQSKQKLHQRASRS